MKKVVFLTILIAVLIPLLFVVPENPEGEERIFSISRGEGILSISENLESDGLISSKYSFIVYNLLNRTARSLQSGDYLLSPLMGISGISRKIAEGDVMRRRITIVEGWNLKDIEEYLLNEGICEREEFLALVSSGFEEFSFLEDRPEGLNFEGYLFPDTYEVFLDTTCKDLISRMLDNFDKKLSEEIREEIKRQEKTIFEIINMASLIEKEVRKLEDKKLVSGVLWKRLEIGMPLQVDATIAYITGKRTTRISLEELEIDSAYNTYRNRGLPIGPISNPGIESIIASVYPEESDYWFYLSAPDGTTIFSRNFEEHVKAKNKYLK